MIQFGTDLEQPGVTKILLKKRGWRKFLFLPFLWTWNEKFGKNVQNNLGTSNYEIDGVPRRGGGREAGQKNLIQKLVWSWLPLRFPTIESLSKFFQAVLRRQPLQLLFPFSLLFTKYSYMVEGWNFGRYNLE